MAVDEDNARAKLAKLNVALGYATGVIEGVLFWNIPPKLKSILEEALVELKKKEAPCPD